MKRLSFRKERNHTSLFIDGDYKGLFYGDKDAKKNVSESLKPFLEKEESKSKYRKVRRTKGEVFLITYDNCYECYECDSAPDVVLAFTDGNEAHKARHELNTWFLDFLINGTECPYAIDIEQPQDITQFFDRDNGGRYKFPFDVQRVKLSM